MLSGREVGKESVDNGYTAERYAWLREKWISRGATDALLSGTPGWKGEVVC